MTDTKYIAAAQKLQSLGYEWKGDEWIKIARPEEYGCHCEVDDGDAPGPCVLDHSKLGNDCVLAMKLISDGESKLDCKEWRPIQFVTPNV